jgi:chromate transporter
MTEELAPPRDLREFFAGFFQIGVLGFGGVNALARRVIVEERRWMSERDWS